MPRGLRRAGQLVLAIGTLAALALASGADWVEGPVRVAKPARSVTWNPDWVESAGGTVRNQDPAPAPVALVDPAAITASGAPAIEAEQTVQPAAAAAQTADGYASARHDGAPGSSVGGAQPAHQGQPSAPAPPAASGSRPAVSSSSGPSLAPKPPPRPGHPISGPTR